MKVTQHEIKNKIIADHKKGLSQEELAMKYGYQKNTIRRITHAYDVFIKDKKKSPIQIFDKPILSAVWSNEERHYGRYADEKYDFESLSKEEKFFYKNYKL